MIKRIIKFAGIFMFFCCIGIFTGMNSRAAGDNFFSIIKGGYIPMFTASTTLDVKYSHYWHDYAAAMGGASQAQDLETQMKYLIGGQTYGPESGSRLFTGFIDNLSRVNIASTDNMAITFTRNDGLARTYSYRFVKDATIDGYFGPIQGYLYSCVYTNDEKYNYLFLSTDTMKTTYHIELRFAATEEDVLNLKGGTYKNWMAMLVNPDIFGEPDEATLQKTIAYHVYRNLVSTASDEAKAQRHLFTGVWDYAFSNSELGTTVIGNAKRYITNSPDGTGSEMQDSMGTGNFETMSEYNYYMYDETPQDSTNSGVYLQYDKNKGIEVGRYNIEGTGAQMTATIESIDQLPRRYIYRSAIAPGKVTISKVKAKKKKIKISWGAVSTADRYQVIVSTTKKFKKLTADKNTAKTSITIKVKKKKTYYVMVRAYVKDAAGEITCGPYSSVKKVKVK